MVDVTRVERIALAEQSVQLLKDALSQLYFRLFPNQGNPVTTQFELCLESLFNKLEIGIALPTEVQQQSIVIKGEYNLTRAM